MRNAKKSLPELNALPDQQGLALINHIFTQLNARTAAIEDGELNVTGLGRFTMTQVKRERRGKMISIKRIQFHYLKHQQPRK